MKTIPLQPIFENEKFNTLSPACQLFFIKAVYLLAQRGLLFNRPKHLSQYFHCCRPLFFRFKQTYENILEEVTPKMMVIKGNYKKQTANGTKAIHRISTERRLKRNETIAFFDENETHQRISPIFSPNKRHHLGQHDPVARAKALEPKTDKDKVFTDN